MSDLVLFKKNVPDAAAAVLDDPPDKTAVVDPCAASTVNAIDGNEDPPVPRLLGYPVIETVL